jgi:hypothetical protein
VLGNDRSSSQAVGYAVDGTLRGVARPLIARYSEN